MEVGRETPSAAECAQLLEAAGDVVRQGVARLARAFVRRLGALTPKPAPPLDD